MKYVYSVLIQENPLIYHIWFLYPGIKHPGDLLPNIVATEISDTVT